MVLCLSGLTACPAPPDGIAQEELTAKEDGGEESVDNETDAVAENTADANLSSPIELIPVDEGQEEGASGAPQEILPPGSVTRLVPIDITIGQLQDHLDSDVQRRAVYDVGQRFLQALVENTVDSELLVPGEY